MEGRLIASGEPWEDVFVKLQIHSSIYSMPPFTHTTKLQRVDKKKVELYETTGRTAF